MSTTQLGPFTLDHQERTLWLGSESVPVQPKVLECIELLARRAGKLVTMERLRSELWPEITVGDDAVRQLIAKARAALRAPGPQAPTIRSRKGLGYVLEADAVAAPADSKTPPTVQRTRDWPIVGRERELAVLREALHEGARGVGRLCLVGGEPGAGKSTLLAILREGNVGLWLEGHCQAGLAQPSFWPFRQLTQRLLAAAELDDNLARAAKNLAACWKRPGVDRLVSTLRPPSAEQRLMLAQALCEQLRALSTLRPLVLVLEDLHWADAGTLLLLELLAREAPKHALVLVATYRHGQTGQNEALGALLARTAGRTGVSELRVMPLSRLELQALLADLRHPFAGSGAAEALQRLTGGNALFVQLLLRHSVSSLAPGTGHDQAPLSEQSVPTSLPHVVMERVQTLPESTRALLPLAAVLGPELPLQLLSRLAQMPVSQVVEQLAPALAAGLLTHPPGQPEQLQFGHALVCEVLTQQLPGHVLRDLHRRVVEALLLARGEPRSSTLQSVPEAAPGALAWHAFLAGDALPIGQTRELCERAGRECLAQLAFDQAVLHLTRALSLAPESMPKLLRAELTLLRAQACWEADLRPALIAAAFDDATVSARAAGSAALLAEAAIWAVVGPDSPGELYAARERQDQVCRLEEAFGLLAADDIALKHRLARTLTWMRSSAGDITAARRWADEAVNNAGAADAWTNILALGIRCSRAIWSNQRDVALALLAELHTSVHHPQLSVRERVDGRMQLMVVCLWLGDGAGYRTSSAELAALVQKLPQPPRFGRLGERFAAYSIIPTLTRMTLALIAGELTRAHELLAELMAEAARVGLGALDDGGVGMLLVMPLLQYQGRCQILQPMVEAGRAAMGECGYRLALAEIAVERGAMADARAHFGALRELGFRTLVRGQKVPASPRQLAAMADVCVVVGDQTDAQLLYDELLPSADFLASDGLALSVGCCARPLGELACQLASYEQAELLFGKALAINQAMGHRPELARTRHGLARCLHALGRSEEAEQLRKTVLEEAAHMGMAPLLSQARDLALDGAWPKTSDR